MIHELMILSLLLAPPSPVPAAAPVAAAGPAVPAVPAPAPAAAPLPVAAADPAALAAEQVKAAEARADARVARAEAAAAETKAESADAKYRDLASGKFIENGITGGLALTLQTPFVGDKADVQQGTAVSTTLTPYLLLVPAYWRQLPETNRFCASHWSTDVLRAHEAADQMARQRAAPVTTTLLNYVQAGLTVEQVTAKDLGNLEDDTYNYSRTIACEDPTAAGCKPKSPSKEELARLTDMMAAEMLDWTPGVRPAARQCLIRKFGLWVGFPVNPYKARVSADKFGMKTDVQREINPVVSFGAAFTPNASVSLLAGVTYSRVTLPGEVMNADKDAGLWTFTFGLGGNLDLINAFRR